MIEIKIDLVPYGNVSKERRIGIVQVANDGTGRGGIGNYSVRLTDENGSIRLAAVRNHKRVDGIYPLLARAFKALCAKQ
jgi:hypothetical protein